MRSCVIVVENLPVPFDRRVWQEAKALKAAGWQVSVICPRTEKYPERHIVIEDIAVYRHDLPLEAKGKTAFLIEYGAALFHELRLLFKVKRERGFDVIHACNPPDLIFMAALPFKLFGRTKFVYDQHDVCPELFVVKFGRKGFLHRALLFFEKRSARMADIVITANDTFRDLIVERCGKRADDVVSVYSVPDRTRLRRVEPSLAARNGKRFVLGYVGIISDQDGLDHMVEAVRELVHTHGFTDFQAVVVGDGPGLPGVKAHAAKLNVTEYITFTGFLGGEELLAHLSAFDVGVIPDPLNDANDKMSMNKVFEYSTLGIPTVTYPLTETKRLMGAAGVYAETPDPSGLAIACLKLFRDDALRERHADDVLALARRDFSWDKEAAKLVAAYERLAPMR